MRPKQKTKPPRDPFIRFPSGGFIRADQITGITTAPSEKGEFSGAIYRSTVYVVSPQRTESILCKDDEHMLDVATEIRRQIISKLPRK